MLSNGLLCCAQTQSVSELKDFVKKLNSLPEMTVSIFLPSIFHFRDLCVFPIDFNFLKFVALEAHKSCSASVDIHIKASLSWATWHGTHNCWGTELWHVSTISTVIFNFWRPNVLIICFSLYNICEYTQCKCMLIG